MTSDGTLTGLRPIPTGMSWLVRVGGAVRELDAADVPMSANVGTVEFTESCTDTCPIVALGSATCVLSTATGWE